MDPDDWTNRELTLLAFAFGSLVTAVVAIIALAVA